eukprot:CAMPEP_0194405500 /NCGR_PEP_ID=MMETSP0176-20130528/3867_1 /TAXON_ID=216777 /ORGANISM="Proboscia alata, Strain PI-D3" /LENGTH=122 /DNA_ID=CAMNT_0039204325 /DNA_START=1130 /DNA_END=1498 /DNA_ORIENTATION=-
MLIFLPLLGVLITITVMVGIELQDRALKKPDTGSNFKDPLKDNSDPLIPRASKNLANICNATVAKDHCATCKSINSVFGLLHHYADPIKTNPNVNPMEDIPKQGGIVVPPEYSDIFKILADV